MNIEASAEGAGNVETVRMYFDIYVLAPERSVAAAERFLDAFVPRREQAAAEYEFPRYSNTPTAVYESASEAIRHCAARSDSSQSLYFRNLGPGVAHAMLFFTTDGALILGLSVAEEPDAWLDRLREHAGADLGYWMVETPPPATSAEFKRNALRQAAKQGFEELDQGQGVVVKDKKALHELMRDLQAKATTVTNDAGG